MESKDKITEKNYNLFRDGNSIWILHEGQNYFHTGPKFIMLCQLQRRENLLIWWWLFICIFASERKNFPWSHRFKNKTRKKNLTPVWQIKILKLFVLKLIKKNPKKCNNVSQFYYSIFIWRSTFFGWHTAHHQESKTTLATSSFLYVEGC
jgi:hypothetical protein